MLGKRKRVYGVPYQAYEGAKQARTTSAYPQLGADLLARFMNPDKGIKVNIKMFGQNVPLFLGEKSQQLGKIAKAYPQLYGKTKTKNYDYFQSFQANGPVNMEQSIQDYVRGVYQGSAPPQYTGMVSLNLNKIIESLSVTNKRFARSMQWYLSNNRVILNAKPQISFMFDQSVVVVLDYVDDVYQKDPSFPIHDRVLVYKGVSFADVARTAPTSDTSQIMSVLQQNVADNSMIEGYTQEQQSVLAKLDQVPQAINQNIISVKIPFLAFVKDIKIYFTGQKLDCFGSYQVKYYYKQSVFEPYHRFLYKQVIPAQVMGTSLMINNGKFDKTKQIDEQIKQLAILKGSAKRIGKLRFMLQNQEVFKSVYTNPNNSWKFILQDWASIIKDTAGNVEHTYGAFKSYNKGILRMYQSVYMSDPNELAGLYTDLPTALTNIMQANGISANVLLTGTQQLATAYKHMQQQGAQDVVTFNLLTALDNALGGNKIERLRDPRSGYDRNNRPGGGGNSYYRPGNDGGDGGQGGGPGGNSGGGQIPRQQQQQRPPSQQIQQQQQLSSGLISQGYGGGGGSSLIDEDHEMGEATIYKGNKGKTGSKISGLQQPTSMQTRSQTGKDLSFLGQQQ